MTRQNPVASIYDRLAPIYDRRWRSYGDATLRAVLDALDCRGDERILDVACGTGELEGRLLARWPALRIVAADLSSGMLNQAVEKDNERHVFWIHADVANLPLADNSFDFVFCSSSFHYFRSPTRSLREMYRVLRPGGALVCMDWCDDYLTCKACSWWLRWTDSAFYRTYASSPPGPSGHGLPLPADYLLRQSRVQNFVIKARHAQPGRGSSGQVLTQPSHIAA